MENKEAYMFKWLDSRIKIYFIYKFEIDGGAILQKLILAFKLINFGQSSELRFFEKHPILSAAYTEWNKI